MNIVPVDKLGSVWAEVAPWIAEAIEFNGGDENLTDVLISLAVGRYMLWLEPGRYCGVIEIQNHPRQRVALVVYCGGHDLEGMRQTFEYGKAWCRENGIAVIRTLGRAGWERVLKMDRRGVTLEVRV